jgi:stage II sporulation protein M
MNTKKIKKAYKESFHYVAESKSYVFAITAIFLVFIAVGIIFKSPFEEKILELIKEMMNLFLGKNLVETISLIFLNNARACLFSIALGIMFGILPIISAIFNGYLVGFVIKTVTAQEGLFVLWRLLPHGIFELPAVLISMGLGLRIGLDLFKDNAGKKLKRNFRQSMNAFFRIILPLLIVAAIIEGTLIFFFG